MKTSSFYVIAFLLICPAFLSAQAIAGSWMWKGTNPEGKEVKNMITFQEDGIYKVDLGMNGKYEIEGTYTNENGQASITDTSEGPCKGITGVYEMKVEENEMTAKMVSDQCTARAGDDPNRVMTMKRVN